MISGVAGALTSGCGGMALGSGKEAIVCCGAAGRFCKYVNAPTVSPITAAIARIIPKPENLEPAREGRGCLTKGGNSAGYFSATGANAIVGKVSSGSCATVVQSPESELTKAVQLSNRATGSFASALFSADSMAIVRDGFD